MVRASSCTLLIFENGLPIIAVTRGIDGFGGFGTFTLSHTAESAHNGVQIMKINTARPRESNAHLLRCNSIHGRSSGIVKADEDIFDFVCGPALIFQASPRTLD